jgi:copper chaperone
MSTTQQKTLSIEGMHCDHCVEIVREALTSVRGVSVGDVEIGAAEVEYDPATTSLDQLEAVLDDAGYELSS